MTEVLSTVKMSQGKHVLATLTLTGAKSRWWVYVEYVHPDGSRKSKRTFTDRVRAIRHLHEWIGYFYMGGLR